VASDGEWRVKERSCDSVRSLRTRILVGCSVPKWEELVYTPAVFVRVANKRLKPYATWKSIRKTIEEKRARVRHPAVFRKSRI